MSQPLQPGDFLVFQLEAGFALMRVLDVHGADDARVWHLTAYNELFADIESAESACNMPARLTVRAGHIAVTNRAFESTQVAKIANVELTEIELGALAAWGDDPNREISDRSVRLLLGLR